MRPSATLTAKWSGPSTSQGVSSSELEMQIKQERAAISSWVRAEQAGGVQAIAKDLICSLNAVHLKLEGFATTKGVHKYLPAPGEERHMGMSSSKGSIIVL